MAERTVQIVNKNGLHARPAAEIVKTAAKFKSEITIVRDDLEVNGKSIMGVMMLAAEYGSTIIAARRRAPTPRQARRRASRSSSRTSSESAEWSESSIGIPASPGIVVGPVHLLRWEVPEVRHRIIPDEAIPARSSASTTRSSARKERLRQVRDARRGDAPARRKRRSSTCSSRSSTTRS